MVARVTLAAVALFVGAVVLYFWFLNPLAWGQPKDTDLIALFRENHPAFEKLRAMGTQDSGITMAIRRDTLGQVPLSEARRDEYLRLMAFDKQMTIGVARD
jgi:hypothetical protein